MTRQPGRRPGPASGLGRPGPGPASVSAKTLRPPCSRAVARPSSSNTCSRGYTDPGLGRHRPPDRSPASPSARNRAPGPPAERREAGCGPLRGAPRPRTRGRDAPRRAVPVSVPRLPQCGSLVPSSSALLHDSLMIYRDSIASRCPARKDQPGESRARPHRHLGDVPPHGARARGGGRRPAARRIAERLDQSVPTVSQTVARMERDGLLTVTPDRRIELTAAGRSAATRVMRKHRLAECLLVDVIGLDWQLVHDEACRWEHVMSEAVERRLLEILGHPTRVAVRQPDPRAGRARRKDRRRDSSAAWSP